MPGYALPAGMALRIQPCVSTITAATPYGHASLRPWILSGWICGATDMRSKGNEGSGFFEVSQSGGLRMATGAHTTNIILESRRAAGVGWIKAMWSAKPARAEVLLAAGSVNLPKLLEQSGIQSPAGVQFKLASHYLLTWHFNELAHVCLTEAAPVPIQFTNTTIPSKIAPARPARIR